MVIVFTSSQSLIGRAIRFATRSEVSHVALRLSLEGIPVFMHADVGGVQINSHQQFHRGRSPKYLFHVKATLSIAAAVSCMGTRYDYPSLLGHAFRSVLKWMGYSWKRPIQSPRMMVCSEFIARLPLPAFANLDPENITPGELLEVCRSSSDLNDVPIQV